MKAASHPPAKKTKLDLHSPRFTFSNAKANLGRLMEKAMKGERVYIVRGRHQFVLQAASGIESIPIRPPGYFANCYTPEEIALENRLSKASPKSYFDSGNRRDVKPGKSDVYTAYR